MRIEETGTRFPAQISVNINQNRIFSFQNKHIQCIQTCLTFLSTAVYAHSGSFICLSFLPDFIRLSPVLIDRNRNFKSQIQFLINRNRNFEKSLWFLINRNRNSGKVPEFRFLIRFRLSPRLHKFVDTNMINKT